MLRRGKKPSGVRAEVLRRIHGVEHRCELLEGQVDALALAERLAEAMRRITYLEQQLAETLKKTG